MSEGTKIGRPTKCTPEAIAIICAEVAKGIPKKYAGVAAGVTYQAMMQWEELAKEGHEPFLTFAREMQAARRTHIAMRLEAIESGAGDWKRQAWLLERLEPTLFAPTTRTQISGPDGGPVQAQAIAQVVVVPEVAATADAWAAKHSLTPPGTDEE